MEAEREEASQGIASAAAADDAKDDHSSEVPVLKARRQPHQPTAQEILDHEVTHEPYRDWCPACVAGSGRSDAHGHHDHSEDAIAVIAIDYGYMGDGESEERASPIIFGRDGKHR